MWVTLIANSRLGVDLPHQRDDTNPVCSTLHAISLVAQQQWERPRHQRHDQEEEEEEEGEEDQEDEDEGEVSICNQRDE